MPVPVPSAPTEPHVVGPADPDDLLHPYDAVVLVSFGGPEEPAEVMPFLRRVTAGRDIPDERLAAVAEHYHAVGGRSPINDQCRALLAALRETFDERGIATPLAWGNRNSAPFLADTMSDLARSGHRRVLMITTSGYPSYSSCRQYREDMAAAARDRLVVDRIANLATADGFVTANADRLADALARLDADGDQGGDPTPLVLFVTHSVPQSMAETAGPPQRPAEGSYVAWHRAVADRVTARLTQRWPGLEHELVFCSRSGRPGQAWLEPDVNDRLRDLAAAGDRRPVVLAPIGFVSDHMEVINDLDTEALATADEVGLRCVRAGTAGTHPGYVGAIVEAVIDRAAEARGERSAPIPDAATAAAGPGWTRCAPECCVNPRRPDTPSIGQLTGG